MSNILATLKNTNSPQFKKLAAKLAEKRADIGPFGTPQAGRTNREATPKDPGQEAGQIPAKPVPDPALAQTPGTAPEVKTAAATPEKIVMLLNQRLAHELAAIAMYLTYSAKIVGPYRPALAEFLAEEIPDETKHAQFLADKIVAMGGVPETNPAPVAPADSNQEILKAALEAEAEAVGGYTALLQALEGFHDQALRIDIENILTDEQGHYEETLKIVAGFGQDRAAYA